MGITAAEWRGWILARIGRLDQTSLPVSLAHGRTLVEDVRSRYDLPRWNSSAMDGYALRSTDTSHASEASPASFAITGEVLAGSQENPGIAAGCAVRIMTGAPVPDDADTVVPFELTTGPGGTGVQGGTGVDGGDAGGRVFPEVGVWDLDAIQLTAPISPGANIRRRGDDIVEGSRVARSGDPLTAARLSALAAAGVSEVRVSERPRAAVLVTGAELRAPGDVLERGQIVESNSLLLAGLLRECGIEPVAVRRCGDDVETVRAQLDELSQNCDVIISTGGVGPGSHDVVRLAMSDEPEVRAVRVAIRPGQPQCAGRLVSGTWIFALPGNPVSAAASFELFVRPALLALQGRAETERPRVPAIAGAAWRGARDHLQVMPVVFEGSAEPSAAPLICFPAVNPRGVSHAVGGHGAVQGYALVGEERGDIAAGDPVDLILVGLG